MGLKYKHSAKTLAEWTALNPVILENEIVIESDTKRLKIGNGTDVYLDLEYSDKYLYEAVAALLNVSERSYADNAAALAGGLAVNDFYHTSGVVKIVI